MANPQSAARKAFAVWWRQWRRSVGAPAGDETTEARGAAFEAWMHQHGAVKEICAAVLDRKHAELAKRSYPPPKILKALAAEIRALK